MAISIAESLHIGIADIMMRKVRSIITILGIVLGIICIMVVLAIISGMNEATLSWMEARGGTAKIEVWRNWDYDFSKGGYASLSLSELSRLRELIPEAKALNPMVNIYNENLIRFKGYNFSSQVAGVLPDFQLVEDWAIQKGRFVNEIDVRESSNVIVLGSTVAKDLFRGIEPIGKRVQFGGQSLEVIGIMEEKSWESKHGGAFGGNMLEYMNKQAFIPLSTAINKYGRDMMITQMSVLAHSSEEAIALGKNLNTILLNIKKGKEVFRVSTAVEQMKMMKQNAAIFSSVFIMIAAISLLVGGIVIMNIMLASIKERTREIGVRLAIGARRRDIFLQFLIQTVLITALGGLFGVALGYSILSFIGEFLQMELKANYQMILVSTMVSVGVGLVFGITPALRASNLDPVEALRED